MTNPTRIAFIGNSLPRQCGIATFTADIYDHLTTARPDMATSIATGMNAYLAGIPEPLYALFGTGYLGYTAARAWGRRWWAPGPLRSPASRHRAAGGARCR